MTIDNDMFERVLDSFSSTIDDVEDAVLRSNLQDIHDSLYTICENIDIDVMNNIVDENEVMRDILKQVLSHEQKQYIRLKYNIDITDVGGYKYII